MTKIYVEGVEHETGITNGPLSNLQSHRINRAIRKAFPEAMIFFSKGHYYCSCFLRFPEDKVVYVSTSDYRHFPQQFYVRTAKHEKDYTGGMNHNYAGFEKIPDAIREVCSRG